MTDMNRTAIVVSRAGLAALVAAAGGAHAWADGRRPAGSSGAANPTPGISVKGVAKGSAVFETAGSVTSVKVSNKAIINYNRLNVAEGTTLQFIQPGSRSRVLNRISGAEPSVIDGSIMANGRVYFVNPAGVIFGPNSVVNVGAMIAAAGDITDADFLSGRDRFQALAGDVVNMGSITSAGDAHLIGAHVENSGSIVAPGGIVSMSAGQEVYISERGESVMVRVDNPGARAASVGGEGAAGSVVNSGSVSGQTVLFSTGDVASLAMVTKGTTGVTGSRIGVGGEVRSATGDISITAGGVRIVDGGARGDNGDVEVEIGVVQDLLASGAAVEVNANGDLGDGNVALETALDFTGAGDGSLALNAVNDVTVWAGVSGAAADSLNLALHADTDASGGGRATVNADINLNGGDLTITGADLALSGAVSSPGGVVSIRPSTTDAPMNIGAGSAAFTLSQTEIDRLGDGWAGVEIGRPDGANSVTVNGATFRDPLTIHAPAPGGKVFVKGDLTGVDDASITIDGSGSTLFLSADLTTSGTPIFINDSVVVTNGSNVTIATTDGGAPGADITVTGGINGQGLVNPWEVLAVNAGAGAVDLQGAVGSSAPLYSLSVTGATIHLSGVTTTQFQHYIGDATLDGDMDGSSLVFSGDTVIGSDVTLSALFSIVQFSGAVDSQAGEHNDLTVNATLTAFEGEVGGAQSLGLLRTDAKPVLWDTNGDGVQNERDTQNVLDKFLTNDPGADVNNDGVVDTADLGLVIGERHVTMLGADVTAQRVDFLDPVAVHPSQITITGSQSVNFGDTLDSQVFEHNAITVLSPDTRFGGIVGKAETPVRLFTDAPGVTRIDTTDIFVQDDFAAFEDNVLLGVDHTLHGLLGADVTFAQKLDGAHDLLVETAGETRFLGAVGSTTALSSLTTDAPGLTRINGPVVNTSGAQAYNDAVRLDGDTAVNAGSAAFAKTIDSQTGENNDLTVNAVTTNFVGEVGGAVALGSLITDEAGTTFIGADITTVGDRLQFGDDVVLNSDLTLTNLGEDGIYFHQTINSDSVATPRDLSLVINNSETGPDIATINFAGDVGLVAALGDLTLGGGRNGVPQVATIVARKRVEGFATNDPTFGITFNVDGKFTMGQNEKFTTIGALDINAGGAVILGDLSVLSDLTVHGASIAIRARTPGAVLLPDGTLQGDQGVEIIAGGVIDFGVAPTKLNASKPDPVFASATLSFSPSLDGWELLQYPSTIDPGDMLLYGGESDRVLDLLVTHDMPETPTTDAIELARQRPGLRPFEDFVNRLYPRVDPLNGAGVPARAPMLAELLNRSAGVGMFNDFASELALRLGAYSGQITVNRLPWVTANELCAAFAALAGADGEALPESRARLSEAYAALAGQDRDAKREALADGALQCLQTGQPTPAQADLTAVATLLNSIERMGLTDFEATVCRSNIVSRVKPESMTQEQFLDLVEAWREAQANAAARLATTPQTRPVAQTERLSALVR